MRETDTSGIGGVRETDTSGICRVKVTVISKNRTSIPSEFLHQFLVSHL